jgi:uncharacterized protein YraI
MNFAQIATCAAALMALSAQCAQAEPALATNNVNMRQGPGTNYPVIATIPGGSTVEVSGCQGEWCSVSWHGQSGYTIATSLDQGGGAPPPSGAGGPPPASGGPPPAPPPPAPEVRRLRRAPPPEHPIRRARRHRPTHRQATRRHPAIITLRVTPRIIIRVPIITARITGPTGTAAGSVRPSRCNGRICSSSLSSARLEAAAHARPAERRARAGAAAFRRD